MHDIIASVVHTTISTTTTIGIIHNQCLYIRRVAPRASKPTTLVILRVLLICIQLVVHKLAI